MIENLLGLDRSPAELSFAHMAARTIVVFVAGVVLLRVGARRSLGRNAGFDILFGVVLGSVLSRAINGQAAFFPTLGASAALVGLHVLLSFLSSRWHWLSITIKGRAKTVVRDGAVDHAALRRA